MTTPSISCVPVGDSVGHDHQTPVAWDDPVMLLALFDALTAPLPTSGLTWVHPDGHFRLGALKVRIQGAGTYDDDKRESWCWCIARGLMSHLRPVIRAIAEKGAKDFVVLSRADYERLLDHARVETVP